jgi:ribosomal protein L37AE/L43A
MSLRPYYRPRCDGCEVTLAQGSFEVSKALNRALNHGWVQTGEGLEATHLCPFCARRKVLQDRRDTRDSTTDDYPGGK